MNHWETVIQRGLFPIKLQFRQHMVEFMHLPIRAPSNMPWFWRFFKNFWKIWRHFWALFFDIVCNMMTLVLSRGSHIIFHQKPPQKTPKFQLPENSSNQKIRKWTLIQNLVILTMVLKIEFRQILPLFSRSKYSHMGN